MKMHLRYSLQGAHSLGESRHAQVAMKDMGITYQHATPQSMGDQWWFWNCEVPVIVSLPSYITKLNVAPMDAIGFGLSKEMAEKIIEFED